MIAQDELVHDNFVLKRAEPAVMEGIVKASEWPGDILHYGEVLRIEREFGKVAHFADPAALRSGYNPRSPARTS